MIGFQLFLFYLNLAFMSIVARIFLFLHFSVLIYLNAQIERHTKLEKIILKDIPTLRRISEYKMSYGYISTDICMQNTPTNAH